MDSSNKPHGLWNEVKGPSKGHASKTAWLLSFIDLTGILIGLFVLMFSTQVIDRGAWTELTGSFQAAFNPQVAVMKVMPQGQANAMEVVTVKKDVLPYLDSLLRSRLKNDAVWGDLQGKVVEGRLGREMVYDIPAAALELDKPEAVKAWQRVALVVRAWKNPVMVRAQVAEGGDMASGAKAAAALAQALVQNGAVGVAGEVVSANMGGIKLVVRGE